MDVARGSGAAAGSAVGPARVAGRLLAAAGHGPLGVAIRAGGVALAAVLAAVAHRAHDPGVLCPVRAITGVPCPLCGGTSVFMELGAAHPVKALAANPFALGGTIGLITAPLGTGRMWWAITARARAWLIGTVLALSWLWQLARFGLLQW